ncbi:hypothetical protein [Aggregatibacter sp.]|mgnify:FL=1|jgi:lipoprotein
MKVKNLLTILVLSILVYACKDEKERFFPEEKFIDTYTEKTRTILRQNSMFRNAFVDLGIFSELDYYDFVNCTADTYTALTEDMDWMKKVVNEDISLNTKEVEEKSRDLSYRASKICMSELTKRKLCNKKEVISGFSKGNYSLSMPDGQGNIVKLTKAECGYISPYKLDVLGNGYMCAISFGSRVDNLVVSGLEVNGTFLHNFKAHKTLQRSFIVNKGEYKEFQDNSGPCNIKELVIHTNKGIFVERK